MTAWQPLTSSEYDDVWNRFEGAFWFTPSMHPEDWPGFREPTPSITYDISQVYGGGAANYVRLVSDLLPKTIGAFRIKDPDQNCLASS
jgi:hypothetical protein